MSVRQVYEAILIELHKENAPNIILEDFNYLFNKSINQYVNKRYNAYDINQQTTDDLRVLKATALLSPKECNSYGDLNEIGRMMGATYEVILPSDYLHILNCICIYSVNRTYKCYNKGDKWRCAAKRLTADMYSQVLDNFWQRPTYKNPYYYIHNVNLHNVIPTDPIRPIGTTSTPDIYIYVSDRNDLDINYVLENKHKYSESEGISANNQYIYVLGPKGFSFKIKTKIGNLSGRNKENSDDYTLWRSNQTTSTDDPLKLLILEIPSNSQSNSESTSSNIYIGTDFQEGEYSKNLGQDGFGNDIISIKKNKGVNTSVLINGESTSNIERAAQVRYGNASSVRMEIRYGTDTTVFTLEKVYIDYIKSPQFIRLTQEQLDLTEDTSQVLEFPDYVCQEIINELVHIIMENIQDPRIQTHPVVSQSIANPAQQQTEPVAQQQQ